MYDALSTRGSQGWEVTATAYTTVGYGETKNFTFVLKRPKDASRSSN